MVIWDPPVAGAETLRDAAARAAENLLPSERGHFLIGEDHGSAVVRFEIDFASPGRGAAVIMALDVATNEVLVLSAMRGKRFHEPEALTALENPSADDLDKALDERVAALRAQAADRL